MALDRVILDALAQSEVLGLPEAVARAERVSGRAHVNVETVFTKSRPPLVGLAPASAQARLHGAKELQILLAENDETSWFIASWATRHTGVYHLVTNLHSTDPMWAKVERWIGRSREVTRVFLDHKDFLSVAAQLNELGEVEVGRVSSRSAFDGSSANRGWGAVSARNRPDPRTVVSDLLNQGQSVRTITLHVDDILSVHLRRSAGATYYSGDFEVFSARVLGPLADAAASRRTLLSDRERKIGQRVQAVSVDMGYERFNSPKETSEVLTAIAGLSRTTIAVFHRNPYLHVAVTDEVDGSNFDVLVTDSARVDIYPGFLASAAALARLSNHLADRFGAQDMQERPTRQWTLADVTGD